MLDREFLKQELNELMSAMMSYPDQDTTFGNMYVSDITIRSLADAVLVRCGVNPATLDRHILYTLLFPYEIEGEKHDVGVLAEINELVPSDTGTVSEKDLTKEYVKLLAQLWELNGDLKTALEAAKTVPADVLLGMMEEMSFMRASPEQRKKLLQQRAMEEAKAEFDGVIPMPAGFKQGA